MKKFYQNCLAVLLLTVVGIGFVSCSSDDTPSQESILQKAAGIIELKSGIANWDAAYLTKSGYFCYKKSASSTANKYSSVAYMPADGSDIVDLVATKLDNIPTQMVTKSGILYFSPLITKLIIH